MNKQFDELLSADDKKINEAQGALSHLFRKILIELNVKPNTVHHRLDRYIKDPMNGYSANNKEISTIRGNLIKGIKNSNMSWNVFLTNLKILGPSRIKITVELGWKHSKATEHSVVILDGKTRANTQTVQKQELTDDSHSEDDISNRSG